MVTKFGVGLCLMLSLLLGCSHLSGSRRPASDSRIQTVTKSLQTIFQCSARVWPGLEDKNFRFLFVQPSSGLAWLWESSTSKIEKVSMAEVPAMTQEKGRYSFEHFRGERAVLINFDQISAVPEILGIEIDPAVNTAFHEGFHYLFQMKEPWVAHFTSADRKADLDFAEALYSRHQLIKALKTAYQNQTSYHKAAFWFRRWQATGESPETRFSDVVEGTALYAEMIGVGIAQHGCDVSEAELLKTVDATLDHLVAKPMPTSIMRQFFAEYKRSGYQKEGYEIGLLSLLALRRSGRIVGQQEYAMGRDYVSEIQQASQSDEKMKAFSEMKKAVENVRTPVELLLNQVPPTPAADDEALLAQIREALKE